MLTVIVSAVVTVVIVHWNQPASCCAVASRFLADQVDCRVVVVDNASTPAHLSALRAGLPSPVELLESGANLGFGPGANVGLQHWLDHHDTNFVALCPHDAEPASDTLRRCIEALCTSERRGLASADVGDAATPLVQPYLGAISGPMTVTSGWEPADYPHGTLMIMRRSCAADIGFFDERYFAYCEEADLGLRAARAGWEVGIVRGALVGNPQMGPTASLIDYLMVRNTVLLLRENFGLRQALFRVAVVLVELFAGVVRPHTRTPFHTPRSRVLALRDVVLGRYGPPPKSLR